MIPVLLSRRGGGAASGPVLWLRGETEAYSDAAAVSLFTDTAGSRNFAQGTGANRPAWSATKKGATFDGSNDYLTCASPITDTAAGSISLVFFTGATAFATRGNQVLFASADEGSANNWFEIGVDGTGRVYVESNTGGTVMRLTGSTFLEQSTGYWLLVTYGGTDYYAQVAGVEQNPLSITGTLTGKWLGNVSGADNLTLGGTVTSAGLVRPFQGTVSDLRVYSTDIT